MGTYTNNYNLFMPSIGEQGWGDLVNGNFTTIDATMKGLDTRIGTLETEADAVEERVTTLEAGEFETINAETITADEFVGGVGNFSKLTIQNALTLSYNGYSTYKQPQYTGGNSSIDSITIISSVIPFSGVFSCKADVNTLYNLSCWLLIVSESGSSTITLTNTQTEYNISNAYTINILYTCNWNSDYLPTVTYGIPILT